MNRRQFLSSLAAAAVAPGLARSARPSPAREAPVTVTPRRAQDQDAAEALELVLNAHVRELEQAALRYRRVPIVPDPLATRLTIVNNPFS